MGSVCDPPAKRFCVLPSTCQPYLLLKVLHLKRCFGHIKGRRSDPCLALGVVPQGEPCPCGPVPRVWCPL